MEDLTEIFDQAKRMSQAGHHLQAAVLYLQVAEQSFPDKECVALYLLAANEYCDSEMVADAIDLCRKAIEINPDSVSAWRSLGRILAIEQDDAEVEAEHALKKSLGLKPSATACVYLTVLYIGQDRLEEAEKICRQALELAPDFYEAYFNFGQVMRKQSRWDEALAAFRTAIELSPDYSLAHRELGSLFFELGELDRAEYHVRTAHHLKPNDAAANDLLVRIQDKIEGRF